MAEGYEPRQGVQIGSAVTEAIIGAYPPANQLMQFTVNSTLGNYILYVTTSGINLYDGNAQAVIGRLYWNS